MSKKIKIKIIDRKDNFKFSLPALPLWMIEKIVVLGLKIARKSPTEHSKHLEIINDEDIKVIFKVLKENPPFTLVEVKDYENEIEIYTI